jgi:uncharacterized protein
MTALDAPIARDTTSDHRVKRRTASPRVNTAFAAVLFAASVIAVHLMDALMRQAPTYPVLWVGLCAFGLIAVLLLFVYSGELTRGLLSLVVGLLAVIEGFGVAVAHTIKGATAGADITGLGSAAAGVGLLVLGVVLILRRVGGWQRWLALPLGFAVLAYFVAPLSMAVSLTHSNPGALSGRTPAEAGLQYEQVTLPARDGVQLSGWYIPSRNRAAVLAIPGAGGTRDGVLDHSIVLARHGYGVLDLDPRGHGLSEGAPMDLGWFGEFDVDAGVGFLSNRPEVDPTRIAVLGTSMGGEEALTTAANDPRIAAVVNEGGYCRVFDDLAPVFEHDRAQLALLPYYWTLLSSARLTTSAQPPTPLSRAMAQTSPRPVLLIAASEEPEMTVMAHLHDVAPRSSELWLAPNTPHTQALYVHPGEWSTRVLTFLDRALLSDPGR